MSKKRDDNKGFYKKLASFLAGNKFFYGVVGLSVFQGLWYALTFQPTIFDEGQHLGFITAYSHQLSPFITKQPISLDYLGEVTRTSSYLYYYLMSWPLRFIDIFTHNLTFQIIFLRLINIALFALGLIIYRKLFIKAGAPRLIINLTLLFIVLTPALALLGGAVNYDNALFPLSGLALLLALEVIQDKRLNPVKLSSLIIVGLLGSIMKFEFMAIFAPIFLYVTYDLWSRYRGNLFRKVKSSFKTISLVNGIIIAVLMVISVGLFIERPVQNAIKYHNIAPDCSQLYSQARCNKNYTALRDQKALASKPANFSPASPFNYMLEMWIPGMITTQTILLSGKQPQVTLLRLLYYAATLGGVVLVIAYIRDLTKNKAYKFLTVVMVSYTFILAAFLYKGYVKIAIPAGVTSRYLLPVMPIFILFVGLAAQRMLIKRPTIATVILFTSLIVMTQGGGITTYVLTDNSSLYWHNRIVVKTNDFMKKVAHPLVIER